MIAMPYCTSCGNERRADHRFCPFCGAAFSAEKKEPLGFKDRQAIAGLVLSLFGLLTVISLPVQAVGLILSVLSVGTKRCKVFAVLGILFSAIALLISGLVWTEFLLNW